MISEKSNLLTAIAGEQANLIGFLRDNIERMKFDPATRKKWGL